MKPSEIILKYPNLFGEPPFDPMKTLIGFGFEVGKGWLPLLEDMFEKLDKLQKEQNLDIRVVQVKEKFGGLRVYVDGANKDVNNIINEAVNKASKTCEKCGNPGILQTNGWFYVACEQHIN